jgi:hypothetical protein
MCTNINVSINISMKKNKILKITTVCILSILTFNIAIAALIGGGPAEGWTILATGVVASTSIGAITAFGTAFSASMQTTFEQIISAVAVATSQESVSANNVSESSQKSAQTLVAALKSEKQAADVTNATFNYSPTTGQGFQPCETSLRNKTLTTAFSDADKNISKEMQESDLYKYKDSKGEAVSARLDKHYDKFCTASEEKQGLCKVDDPALSGADTNASLLFQPAIAKSDKDIARRAYIDTVIGIPDQKNTIGSEKTQDSKLDFINKIGKDALSSIPAYSLNAIKLANTKPDEKTYSPNQLLNSRVNQYFGGEEAQKWAETLAVQTPRGLMVENLKIHGLEVWMHNKSYQQNQRLEANLAALLLIESKAKQNRLEKDYAQIVEQNK